MDLWRVIYMVLHVHGPCTETVRVLTGFKLSAWGVQTQRTRSSNSACGATTCHPPSTHPQCHLPHPVASPSRHPCCFCPCWLPVTLAPCLPCPVASPSCCPCHLHPCPLPVTLAPCLPRPVTSWWVGWQTVG